MKPYITLCLAWIPLAVSCSNQSEPFITATAEFPADYLGKSTPLNTSKEVSLAELANRVASNNPQLRAARMRIREAQGQVVQSGRLSNPELGVGLNKSIPGSEGGMEVSFSQRFPVTNRLALEKRISKQQLAIAAEEVKTAERDLVAKAQEIAVEIILLRQKRSELNKQASLLETLANFITEAANRGELSPLDANQAQVEASSIKSKMNQLQSEENILLGKLRAYIGLSAGSPLSLSGSLPSARIPSQALALQNLSEYRAKQLEIEQAQQAIALAKANRYEDVEASTFASIDREEDAPEGLETEGVIGIGVKIPLQFYNRNEGNIASARARAARITLEKDALALELKQNAANFRTEMNGWISQNENITSSLIPLAQKNSKQLETAYRNGQAPFTSLLKARNQELDLENTKLENLAAFHKARVRYFAAIGKTSSTF
ncbi:Outer membrane protein TolC [Rubritalea squalenifaciens DSM 18772]|uniref:Outer membrane protein TolC n=1 Tax=Rubritalea squalenifaciens DSM 18772 TaxID=1123071 RepID=A0A1M6IN98_9BACT|nr:TolC family protein [Rubritalea squalenifaciens]SHJ35880.1 Outer membrane protein TolC [Rubritalea squalenifaciens DSM 18772]